MKKKPQRSKRGVLPPATGKFRCEPVRDVATAFEEAFGLDAKAKKQFRVALKRSKPTDLTAEELRTLAERAYPGLKPSGLCSNPSHWPGRKGGKINVECTTCFPDVLALIDAHNDLKQKAWTKLRKLGQKIPGIGS